MPRRHNDTLVGTLNYSDVLVATATMSYGHETMQPDDAERAAGSSGVVLKIMPACRWDTENRRTRQVRLCRCRCHQAYTSPGTLEFHRHTLAPLAKRGKRT
jgi:acetoacetate decarboxylase